MALEVKLCFLSPPGSGIRIIHFTDSRDVPPLSGNQGQYLEVVKDTTSLSETIAQPCDPSHWKHLLKDWSACQGEGQVQWPCEFKIRGHLIQTEWMPVAFNPEARVA